MNSGFISMKTQITTLRNGIETSALIGPVPGMKPVLALVRRLLWAAAIVSLTTVGLVSAQADNIAYVVVGGGGFGTLDLNTGAFTLLGSAGQTLGGLGEANGTLYGTSYGLDSGIYGVLYSINPTNGSLTTVGTSAVSYDVFGSTTSGLYSVDRNELNLYSLNATNGAATLIGPTGLSLGSYRGISAGGSILFYADGANFYTLNTNTGAATLLGNMGGAEMGCMIAEGGILYGGQASPTSQVATLNPVSGAVTSGPGVTGNGSAILWGLAPYPLAVAPSLTIALAGNSAIVSWLNTSNYTLQQNSNLAVTAGWTTNGYTISTNANGTNSITITPPTGSLFFRLVNP
jgi:hypothetical protein